MEPASSIIRRLGGAAVVTQVTGTAYTAPYRWQASRLKGGTDGFIPRKYHSRLLEFAKKNNISLSAGDFLHSNAEGSRDGF